MNSGGRREIQQLRLLGLGLGPLNGIEGMVVCYQSKVTVHPTRAFFFGMGKWKTWKRMLHALSGNALVWLLL